jgi:hypothetical protein
LPDPNFQACPAGPPEPWLAFPHDAPNSAPWLPLSRALARPVGEAQRASAIGRLDRKAILTLTAPEAAQLAEGLPSPEEARAAYLAECERQLKEIDSQIAAWKAAGRAELVASQQPLEAAARAQWEVARKLKPADFRPYLVRCLDYGYQRRRGVLHAARQQHPQLARDHDPRLSAAGCCHSRRARCSRA